MSNLLKALMRGGTTGEAVAAAVDFDGVNDYLSRSSDLTGNADGKTFTFSMWVYVINQGDPNGFYVSSDSVGSGIGFFAQRSSDGFYLRGYNAGGASIFFLQTAPNAVYLSEKTWCHILVSVDLTNPSNRAIRINDEVVSATWTHYTNDNIDFSKATHLVGTTWDGGKYKERLSNIFLDYTYRDLSVEANRRYFITADRKPAASNAVLTSGIIYLPMNDPATAHINLGTGGNFTLNGTIARSGRGPNQFNVPYSDLDGSADYLSKASITGIADGKQVTFACSLNTDTVATDEWVFAIYAGASRFEVLFESGALRVRGRDTGLTDVLNATYAGFSANRNYQIVFSCDLTDTNKRHLIVNGTSVSPTWATYSNTNIDLTTSDYSVGARTTTPTWDGRLGNVFFHTSYIDLSVPANLAKFVTGTGIDAKPVDMGANGELPLGVQPLIYLPMYGNNAGKNYGSGGDFTVNSGPYTGARGPNEYWGNKADFDGSTGYLSRTSALMGIADSTIVSGGFYFSYDTNNKYLFEIRATDTAQRKFVIAVITNYLYIQGFDSSGTTRLSVYSLSTLTAGVGYYVNFCFDLTDAAKRFIYINGSVQSATWAPYSGSAINMSASNVFFGFDSYEGNYYDGKLSEFYLTTDYIDFSQESNRLKFRDAFGNPVDLTAQIAAGSIPNPAIYMRFDPANRGKNSGTGGDFVQSGAITDAGNL